MDVPKQCEQCHGRGGFYLQGRWRKCECMRMNDRKRRAQQRLHEAGMKRKRMTLFELIQQHEDKKARANG